MRGPSSSVILPVGDTRRWCEPGQTYTVPGVTISPASASLARILQVSDNCWLNCDVKLPGMCCTMITAPGNSRGNNGTSFISVAGPPVEAAITTMGNLLCERGGGGVPFRGASAFGAGTIPGSVRGPEP